MNRRSLLLGLGSALAAPAIVKAENLMKIAALREDIVVMPGVYELVYDVGSASISVIWPPSSTVFQVISQLQMAQNKIVRDLYQALHDNIALASPPGHLAT